MIYSHMCVYIHVCSAVHVRMHTCVAGMCMWIRFAANERTCVHVRARFGHISYARA